MKDLIKPLDFNDIILTQQEKESAIDYKIMRITDKVRELEQNHREAIKMLIEVNKQQISEMNRDHLSEFCLFGIRVKNRTELLEKLTGHSWSEIKNMEV